MKRVVSYSFFRHQKSAYEHPNCGEAQGRFFVNYLPTLVRAHHAVWTGWELRIHHDDRVRDFKYFRALEHMDRVGLLKLVSCGEAKTLCGAMLWRLKPLFDMEVEYVVCRDVDSLPMPRDRRMVEEFIGSGTAVHGILDSVSHSGPLMGGMVAFECSRLRSTGHASVESLMRAGDALAINYNEHGADQRMLNGVVYPYLAPYTMIHCKKDLGYLSFKTLPVAEQACEQDRLANHVGGAFDAASAKAWYDAHPFPELETISSCEAEACL